MRRRSRFARWLCTTTALGLLVGCTDEQAEPEPVDQGMSRDMRRLDVAVDLAVGAPVDAPVDAPVEGPPDARRPGDVGIPDRAVAEPDAGPIVFLENLFACDDGQPNTPPARDPSSGGYARDGDGQLVDVDGRPLRCSERCNGIDDDGDGRVDELRGLVLQTCYSGPPATDPREPDNGSIAGSTCRAGRGRCFDGRYDYRGCDGEVLPARETPDELDNDCDGRIDEASAEVCDARDNDGDGWVDEGFLTPDAAVVFGSGTDARFDCRGVNPLPGACGAGPAHFRCFPDGPDSVPIVLPPGIELAVDVGRGLVCVPALAPFEQPEICDGADEGGLLSLEDEPRIDQDCDGAIDEGVGAVPFEGRRIYPFATACGACDNDCVASAQVLGRVPACVQTGPIFGCSDVCAEDRVDANLDPRDGCECHLQRPDVPGSVVEVCDDRAPNDACDAPCDVLAAVAGMCPCGELGRDDFDAVRYRCGESCNGSDDDCDGRIDERSSLLTPLCYSPGLDAGTRDVGRCRSGRRACIDGELTGVRPAVGGVDLDNNRFLDEDQDGCIDEITPVDEVDDGMDNDCDGRVDEGMRP